MTNCSLAVDIGASGGTVVSGYLENNKMKLDEIHRFENKMIKKNGHFCCDIETLLSEIKKGIYQSKKQGLHPESIGIDIWAVEYVLLDENDELLTDAVAYRDHRKDSMMEEVFQKIPREKLYFEIGIQFQKFNTIYQLHSMKKNQPEILAR